MGRPLPEGRDRATLSGSASAHPRTWDGKRLPAISDGYDPALVQADCDLAALARTLARPGARRDVSLLLSGPPGTGKSAYARHLAGMMGLPVLHKRASDLLGPYVGQNEQQIAAAFAEARDTGAFLALEKLAGLA